MMSVALALALVAAAAFAVVAARQRRALARIRAAADGLTGDAGDGVAQRIADAAGRLAALEHRLIQRHPLSGLPTREPLFARIDADRAGGCGGLLGVIWFGDHERLAAFDTALADRVLVTLTTRVSDMMGDGPMIAQIDRARLALWYGPETAGEAARAALTALCYALGEVVREDALEIIPDIRLGVAEATRDADTPQRLLTRAIAALSVCGAAAIADLPDPIEAARRDYAIEQGLRQAIARDEFELRFQPLIDAAQARVCGAEALLRWRHPVEGAISPAEFMPIAESAGLAEEIGLWVLNAAVREARGWQRRGLGHIRVAVNVSGHQLRRPDMRLLVERTLARHGLSPDRLEIELTETVASGDLARAATIFEQIRALGVGIAIDDFGTGYSSLSALRRLGFDKLKIDREFVTDVHLRRDSQAICNAMLTLGKGLGIRVLAEGVETAAEVDWLRRHGCDHFQGYHFARPLEPAAFAAFAADAARLADLLSACSPPFDERLSA